jgi:uncharacterized coiled-coil protein SlyX|tara:strand:- start:210 stop:389 length:180 start_codon:yes stop_codon:yes gene_type:complete
VKYQKVVEERLGQLEDSLARLVEQVDNNALTPDALSKQMSRLVERLTQVRGLVELEDED